MMTSSATTAMGVYGFEVPKAIPGTDSEGRMTYAEIAAGDGDPLPEILKSRGEPLPPAVPISFDRYFKREYVDLEVEHIWKKCWQVACREEDIPNVGDRINYDIVHQSYVIVRTEPGTIKAFYNSCPHRGRALCDKQESGSQLRCAFHAWTWNLDGKLAWVPSHEDFPHVDTATYSLQEVRVATWGGNVFINPDPAAPPLADALGILPELFADCPQEDRYTVASIRKKVRCNWKLAQEAFMESYHILETHWDGMPFFGAAHCQYDEYDDGVAHINWLVSPSIVPDFWLLGKISPAESVRQYCGAFGVPLPEDKTITTVAEARRYIADERIKAIKAASGVDFSDRSVGYLIDMVKSFVFPNHHPWWGEGLPWWYRFLPLGDDPEACIMEVRITQPVPKEGKRPAPAAPIDIDFDEKCGDYVGTPGKIIDQDIFNLLAVQKGMKAARPGMEFATLARYQESNIQHFHRVYNKTLGIQGQPKG